MISANLSTAVFAACENTKHNSQSAAVKAVQRLAPEAQPYEIKQVLTHHILEHGWIEAHKHQEVLTDGCIVILSRIGGLTPAGKHAYEQIKRGR